VQLFGDRTKLPPEELVALCHRSFTIAFIARICLGISFLCFIYGQYFLSINDAHPVPQDRLNLVIGVTAMVWLFTGIAFLFFVLVNRMLFGLPRNLVIAIFMEEAINIRNDSSRFLTQAEQARLGKILWKLGVTLALFKSRRMHRIEKKAVTDFSRRYPYIKELILVKDRAIFALLEPHFQNIIADLRTNSMPRFVEDYRNLVWVLERLPDYWEVRSNYTNVKVIVALNKVFNLLIRVLENIVAILKTSQGSGMFIALIVSSILQHFFPR
jgi:hypothetical protein